ncbi:DUF3817 domain-containing protein [Humibacter antri]
MSGSTTRPHPRPSTKGEARAGGITPRSLYRALAVGETVTWSLLIIGMLLKYVVGLGTLPVLIAGSIHGLVFLGYAASSVLVGVNQRWRIGAIILAVASAIVPYATIPFERAMDRRGALDGDWLRDETDDPRDRAWTMRLLRWFLRRPAVLVIVIVLVVLVLMTTLLIIGPPGGWQK